MSHTPHRFNVRVVVFDESDIYEVLRQLQNTAKTMDLAATDTAIMSMKYSRAARISITPREAFNEIFELKPLEPMMFHLTCMFQDREELLELLKDTKKFVENKMKDPGFRLGTSGDVPSLRHSAPFGAWVLTAIEVEPPRHWVFSQL